jgi:hypothetical protein
MSTDNADWLVFTKQTKINEKMENTKASEHEKLREIWQCLSSVDVSDRVETKGSGSFKLSYLSWAWAWSAMMEKYPGMQVEWGPEQKFAASGEGEQFTFMVQCSVTIEGAKRSMWLPVMDHRNKSVVNPTSREISDARMRCLVKCFALFGLGHYIYAGEDVPSSPADASPRQNPVKPTPTAPSVEEWQKLISAASSVASLRKLWEQFRDSSNLSEAAKSRVKKLMVERRAELES